MAATPQTAPTQMLRVEAYANIQGPAIQGEVVTQKFANWIEVYAFGHVMEQPVSPTKASIGGAATGRTFHHDFYIEKQVDAASPKLAKAVSDGTHFDTVTLDVCRAGAGQQMFFEVKMEKVMISKVEMTHSNASGSTSSDGSSESVGFPMERVYFNYGKITWNYSKQDRKTGALQGTITANMDLTTGVAG